MDSEDANRFQLDEPLELIELELVCHANNAVNYGRHATNTDDECVHTCSSAT